MHCHRVLGRLGVEERVEHAALLLAALMARLHHVRTFCVPICLRILQVTIDADLVDVDRCLSTFFSFPQFSHLVVLRERNLQVPLDDGSHSC